MTNIFTHVLTTRIKNVSAPQQIPSCPVTARRPLHTQPQAPPALPSVTVRWISYEAFYGHGARWYHCCTILHPPQQRMWTSVASYELRLSLVRLVNVHSSSECPEVSLCGMVLFCFRHIEHAFVFNDFPLIQTFIDFIFWNGREKQGIRR